MVLGDADDDVRDPSGDSEDAEAKGENGSTDHEQ
jgi:hypothetical protein